MHLLQRKETPMKLLAGSGRIVSIALLLFLGNVCSENADAQPFTEIAVTGTLMPLVGPGMETVYGNVTIVGFATATAPHVTVEAIFNSTSQIGLLGGFLVNQLLSAETSITGSASQ